jgi:hypothetical protein
VLNYLNPDLRKTILQDAQTDETIKRKDVSLSEFEIFQDNLMPYVKKYLKGMYSEDTINEMPIIASVNLAKRIVTQEASIYKEAPEREFFGVSEEQEAVIKQVYKDMQIDKKLMKANQYYKLQGQTHIQILPFQGKLASRVLLNHHLDVVPSPINPEMADAYVVSGFDKSRSKLKDIDSDTINELSADPDDYKASTNQLALWSDQFNFIMDNKGNIISGENVSNDLEMMPFVEVAPDKDFEYWVRRGQAITDFTIQFNGALSDMGHIVRMQGFAQAWMKGPANSLIENVQIGPNYILKLPIDPNNPVETDFGFASPSPDLAGSISYIEMLLSNFLTSRGLDPKLVSGKGQAQSYSSGIERLLAMFEKFDASRSDLSTFEDVEIKIFEIVKQYLNKMSGSVLNYRIAPIPEDASVSVKFKKPEMVQTDDDKLNSIQRKIELGLISNIDAIMEYHGIEREDAIEKKAQIDEDVKLVAAPVEMPEESEVETIEMEENGETAD